MNKTVKRVAAPRVGRRGGLHTLEQAFRFDDVSAKRLADALWKAPLIGPRSVFGEKRRAVVIDADGERTVRDFSPAPMFLFDVIVTRPSDDLFVLRFDQPSRDVPYLSGEMVWIFRDADGGAILEEHINTERALEHISTPLTGAKPSLRRWLFFRVGHARVMDEATRNLAALV